MQAHAGAAAALRHRRHHLAAQRLAVDPALAGDAEIGTGQGSDRSRPRPAPAGRRAPPRLPAPSASRRCRRRHRRRAGPPMPAEGRPDAAPARPPAAGSRPSAARTPRPRPAAPSSGLSTSSAATSDTPSGTLPSARRRPAPPSVVAVPPTPTTIRVPPSAIARPISSPAPSDVAASGSGARSATRHMPQASATSSRRLAAAQIRVSGLDRTAARVVRGSRSPGAATRRQQRGSGALAAVGQRNQPQIVPPARPPSPRQRLRRLIGAVGAPQLVRRDHDPHPRDPIRWRGSWCWWPSTRRSPAPPAAAPAAPPTRA